MSELLPEITTPLLYGYQHQLQVHITTILSAYWIVIVVTIRLWLTILFTFMICLLLLFPELILSVLLMPEIYIQEQQVWQFMTGVLPVTVLFQGLLILKIFRFYQVQIAMTHLF